MHGDSVRTTREVRAVNPKRYELKVSDHFHVALPTSSLSSKAAPELGPDGLNVDGIASFDSNYDAPG
jgi:hypothetical protein